MDQGLRDALATYLYEQFQLNLSNQVYSQQSVAVYKCRSQTQQDVIVKVQKVGMNRETQEREVQIMMTLSRGNIIQLYGWFPYQYGVNQFIVILMESCELDLQREITYRKNNNYYWSEEELGQYFYALVDAFAYMQGLGLAHRDIKPQNIFLTANKTPKVGDLGSSKEIMSETLTLTGTPFYLSPILKYSLQNRVAQVHHNVFKSDVYSLGLTFLTMARLESPMELTNLNTLYEMTEAVTSSLGYSDTLKYLLRCMLQVEETYRCTFLDIQQWFQTMQTPEPQQMQPADPQQVPNFHENEELVLQGYAPVNEAPAAPVIAPSQVNVAYLVGSIRTNLLKAAVIYEPPPPANETTEENKVSLTIARERTPSRASQIEIPSGSATGPIHCMYAKCNKAITSYKGVVQLYCNPSEHVFCSTKCFEQCLTASREKLHEIHPTCPKCKVEISQEVLTNAKVKTGTGDVNNPLCDKNCSIQ